MDDSLKPRKQVLIKFGLLISLMAGYFVYLTYEYNILTGGVAALLTWSFFVLCTPIADAGFLLDFPLRVLFGIRMITSEIVVWLVAILLNVSVLTYAEKYYQTTSLTKIFHQVLTTPLPYWSIIILSALGTFLSIRFGDELLDVLHQRDRSFFHSHQFKHELIILAFFFIVLGIYSELIISLDVDKVIGLPI